MLTASARRSVTVIVSGLCVVSTVRSGMMKERRGVDMRRYGSPMPHTGAVRDSFTELLRRFESVTTASQSRRLDCNLPWLMHAGPQNTAATVSAATNQASSDARLRQRRAFEPCSNVGRFGAT